MARPSRVLSGETAAERGILAKRRRKENIIDFDDKVFNERKAYYKDWEKTSVDGYVATAEIGDTEIESKLIVEPEVAGMDLLKKDYIWWNTDKDYVSLEEFTKQLTKDGYKQK